MELIRTIQFSAFNIYCTLCNVCCALLFCFQFTSKEKYAGGFSSNKTPRFITWTIYSFIVYSFVYLFTYCLFFHLLFLLLVYLELNRSLFGCSSLSELVTGLPGFIACLSFNFCFLSGRVQNYALLKIPCWDEGGGKTRIYTAEYILWTPPLFICYFLPNNCS